MDLMDLATWFEACERSERTVAVVKSVCVKEGGMNTNRTLLYTRRGPAPHKTCASRLLPNTIAMLRRMYGPYCRGPAPPNASSNQMQSNRKGPTLHNTTSFTVLTNPKSVLKKTVTPGELQQPAGNYRKKMLRIESDGLGWGFVVRGTGPCHIQTVEPLGPAAVAGMKVCQLVASINNQSVLEMDYKAINSLILTGPMKIQMEVMEEVTGK